MESPPPESQDEGFAGLDDPIVKRIDYFRDRRKHEFELLNHRMAWLMTTQSFLLIAFGNAFTKSSPNHLDWFGPVALPLIGALVCCLLGIPIYAAHRTCMSWMLNHWITVLSIPKDQGPRFVPYLTFRDIKMRHRLLASSEQEHEIKVFIDEWRNPDLVAAAAPNDIARVNKQKKALERKIKGLDNYNNVTVFYVALPWIFVVMWATLGYLSGHPGLFRIPGRV